MGSFYSGFGGHKSYLGHCEDGIVYSGSGKGSPVGRYENGTIYNGFKENVGYYSGGSIYDSFGTCIASYDDGIVYNKYLNIAVGKEQIGSYEANPAEAAALVLLFLGANSVNGNQNTEAEGSNATNSSSAASSDDGCMTVILALLVAIAKMLWPVVKASFFALWLSSIVAATAVGYLCGFLALACVLVWLTPLASIFIVLAGIPFFSFWPYWAILMWKKIQKRLSWREVCHYYGKWFIKGPLAYKDLRDLKNGQA